MFFRSKSAAVDYCRSQQADIPILRGRLHVVADTRTCWRIIPGEPVTESGWTVAIRP